MGYGTAAPQTAAGVAAAGAVLPPLSIPREHQMMVEGALSWALASAYSAEPPSFSRVFQHPDRSKKMKNAMRKLRREMNRRPMIIILMNLKHHKCCSQIHLMSKQKRRKNNQIS